MDLTQIRYFLTLASTLNFTRAAELCRVTQPALSRGIQRLEEELGGPLVLRERALTQLTDLGRAMLPLLQQTHDAAEAVRRRAHEHRRQEDMAPLRLGVGPSIPLPALVPLLREVVARIEGLDLTLQRREEATLPEALLRGDLDLAILPEATPLPERLNRWPLWPERILVLAPEGHPAMDGPEISATALDGAALFGPGAGTAAAALEQLRRHHGLAAAARHSGGGAEEVGALVSLGLGLALVPDGVAAPAGTVARPLADPAISHPVVLTAAAGRPMNRAVGAFVKLARARAWADPAIA